MTRTETYLDENWNVVDKDKATFMEVTIYDSYDMPYRTLYLKLKK